MTRTEAVERCARALLRERGYNESMLDQYPAVMEKAQEIVICLVELGLLRLDGK
jgi:hypothetical protein